MEAELSEAAEKAKRGDEGDDTGNGGEVRALEERKKGRGHTAPRKSASPVCPPSQAYEPSLFFATCPPSRRRSPRGLAWK